MILRLFTKFSCNRVIYIYLYQNYHQIIIKLHSSTFADISKISNVQARKFYEMWQPSYFDIKKWKGFQQSEAEMFIPCRWIVFDISLLIFTFKNSVSRAFINVELNQLKLHKNLINEVQRFGTSYELRKSLYVFSR